MEALFPLKLERKIKWGRASFISFSLSTEVWLQLQPRYSITVLEMARGASPQLTTHFGLLTSCMKSRKQTNPINVDKSTDGLKKKTSFHIETHRTTGTFQLCTAAGKFYTWLYQVRAGGVAGDSQRGPEIQGDGLQSCRARDGAERIGCNHLSFSRAGSRVGHRKQWHKSRRDLGPCALLVKQ